MIAARVLVSSIAVVVAAALVTVVRRGLIRLALTARPGTIGARHRQSGHVVHLVESKPLRHLREIYRERRRRRQGTRWPAALSLMAREVRSGSSLPTAMSIAADTEPTLNGLAGMVEAMRFASHGDPHQIISAPKMGATQALSRGQAAAVLLEADDRLAMSALRVLLTDGGRVSAGLDRAADAIRGRHTIADQREAQAAQARMSARVLGALAPGFALWTVSTDSRVCSFLLGSIPGLVCVAVGLGLSATGYWWMRRIVNRA